MPGLCGPYAGRVAFSDTPTLTHERVRLEALSHSHATDLARAAGDGDLWREAWYTSIPQPDAVTAEIDRRLALQAAGQMAAWAIIDPSSERAVGMTTYMNIDAANRRVEIGSTWMAFAAQGTGINPAAKWLLLTRAFDDLDCIAVEFRTNYFNLQSRAAIAKLGAKQDGILRSHMIMANGSLRDTVVFSVVSSEWPGVRAGLERRLAR